MAKSQKNHTYVLKLHSQYLKRHKWNLDFSLENIRNDPQTVVALNDSQVLRWLSKIQNRENDNEKANELKKEIKFIKKQQNSRENKAKIRSLYAELYKTMFQQDYMMLVMDKKSDYDRALKGFSITVDGRKVDYVRLIGTAGSIKKSTIIFVNKDVHSELMMRIENGRDKSKELVPAKLEAYQALTCSGSIPVTRPRMIIVNDCITKFNCDVINIDDSDDSVEDPKITFIKNKEIENNASDGFGLVMPSMSAKWAQELHEGELPLSGVNTRYAFTKGMLMTFDFVDFADKIASGNYFVKDAWGDIRDIREADAILTVSMVKLWDSYKSYEDYISNCEKNEYDFSIAKTAPVELESKRNTNYQFLQGYQLNDEQINALIKPTVDNIKDVLGLDWRKVILYLCGTGITDKNIKHINPLFRAIMIDHDLINDKWVREKIMRMIEKRIKEAKIGSLDIEGNFAIICGDPYSLMQSVYNMPVTGLLNPHECYHKYWKDKNVKEIVAFRAPMTSHNNVTKMNISYSQDAEYWYKYINTCMILNSFDDTCMRENGADFDSDTMMTTNNEILVDCFRQLPAIECVQRKAKKIIPTEADFVKSEKAGFGDAIGSTTNYTTGQINLLENFREGSKERDILEKRILCGQLYQQNAIDRIKGIVARPMPSYWIERNPNKVKKGDSSEDVAKKRFNMSIVSDVKPYFFIYRYDAEWSKYNKYIKNVNSNCIMMFGKDLNELKKSSNLSEKECGFLDNYYKYMPVCIAPGVINRICWKIEDEFSSLDVIPGAKYDYSRLKTVARYTTSEYKGVLDAYIQYSNELQDLMKISATNEHCDTDMDVLVLSLKQKWKDKCAEICPNQEILCNIVIDICSKGNNNKSFLWDMCGEQIVKNLMSEHLSISYPEKDSCGDIYFNGERFSVRTLEMEVTNNEIYI